MLRGHGPAVAVPPPTPDERQLIELCLLAGHYTMLAGTLNSLGGGPTTASLADMATVIPIEELRRSPQSALFQGRDEAPISIFINAFERGEGPRMHLHPYPETFVVQAGSARFTAGDDEIEVGAGHLVVVPAETPHRFEGTSDEKVRTVSVHPSPTVVQTDL